MTTAEALEQLASEFEQRRAKLASAAACSRVERHRSYDVTANRAAAAYESDLQTQIDELTWAIWQLRERARLLRDEEAA